MAEGFTSLLRRTFRSGWEERRIYASRDIFPVIFAGIAILLIWEILAFLDIISAGRNVSAYLFGPRTRIPFPHLVLLDTLTNFPYLVRAASITFEATLAGFILGLLIGIAFGALIWRSHFVEATLYPYAVASQMIPIIAIAPIIQYIIPTGWAARMLTASYLTFFPVMVNFARGLKSTAPLTVELFDTYGATRVDKFFKLHFPNALPFLFTGLKIGSTQSVLAAIVVEFMGANDGIGVMILRAAYYGGHFAYRLWSAVIFAGLVGAVLFMGVALAERLLVPWLPELRANK
jgi:NitT/TauT family transport system permease protein